jgi:anti-sigma regulatory factor (Ser/Thr protein kinase)
MVVDPAGNMLVLSDSMKDPYSFESVIRQQGRLVSDRLKGIDLSGITFIEPYSLVSLMLLGRNYLRQTGERLLMVNIPIHIHQYLARMDFFEHGVFDVKEGLDEKLFLKRSSQSSRLLEIIEIPGKERESVKVVFRKRSRNILKYWFAPNIIDYFVTVISELCQNIFEHSLDSGFIAIQTYSMGTDHTFRIAICDSGIGIRESFSDKKNISYESSAQLIEKVLTTPLSSKRRYGYGLCQVNAIMEELRGSVFIRSEDASISIMHHRKKGGSTYSFLKNELPPFPGTHISISLGS